MDSDPHVRCQKVSHALEVGSYGGRYCTIPTSSKTQMQRAELKENHVIIGHGTMLVARHLQHQSLPILHVYCIALAKMAAVPDSSVTRILR